MILVRRASDYTEDAQATFRDILHNTLGLSDLESAIISEYRPVQLTKKNRQTGTMILVSAGAPDADGYTWRTFCLDHGCDMEHETRADAVAWASEPATWCDDCRTQVYGDQWSA